MVGLTYIEISFNLIYILGISDLYLGICKRFTELYTRKEAMFGQWTRNFLKAFFQKCKKTTKTTKFGHGIL